MTTGPAPEPEPAADPYPQLTRLRQVADESQRIGDFLDWLAAQGIMLMSWTQEQTEEPCDGGMVTGCNQGRAVNITVPGGLPLNRPCTTCQGTGTMIVTRSGWVNAPGPQPLLERFYGIDPMALERERRAALEQHRQHTETKGTP